MVYPLFAQGDAGMATSDDLKTVHLRLPVSLRDIEGIELGTIVYLSGTVYTAREGVYRRVLQEGIALHTELAQVSNANFHCSPAAAEDARNGGYRIGAVTATASFRFSSSLGRWLDLTGTKLIIGKGGMPAADYRNVLAPRGVIYLTTVGYGTGALLGRGIVRVRDVFWLQELGIAQAMWLLDVERFGPFIVESDLQGQSLFELHNAEINKTIDTLYAGLKRPALHRFGESDDRRDELI
jgi:L(+)-tartrate dehydratase beta subunit